MVSIGEDFEWDGGNEREHRQGWLWAARTPHQQEYLLMHEKKGMAPKQGHGPDDFWKILPSQAGGHMLVSWRA